MYFSAGTILRIIYTKVALNFYNKKIGVGTAPSNDGIWDEHSELHQHQSTQKGPYSMPTLNFSSANLIHIINGLWIFLFFFHLSVFLKLYNSKN